MTDLALAISFGLRAASSAKMSFGKVMPNMPMPPTRSRLRRESRRVAWKSWQDMRQAYGGYELSIITIRSDLLPQDEFLRVDQAPGEVFGRGAPVLRAADHLGKGGALFFRGRTCENRPEQGFHLFIIASAGVQEFGNDIPAVTQHLIDLRAAD